MPKYHMNLYYRRKTLACIIECRSTAFTIEVSLKTYILLYKFNYKEYAQFFKSVPVYIKQNNSFTSTVITRHTLN